MRGGLLLRDDVGGRRVGRVRGGILLRERVGCVRGGLLLRERVGRGRVRDGLLLREHVGGGHVRGGVTHIDGSCAVLIGVGVISRRSLLFLCGNICFNRF